MSVFYAVPLGTVWFPTGYVGPSLLPLIQALGREPFTHEYRCFNNNRDASDYQFSTAATASNDTTSGNVIVKPELQRSVSSTTVTYTPTAVARSFSINVANATRPATPTVGTPRLSQERSMSNAGTPMISEVQAQSPVPLPIPPLPQIKTEPITSLTPWGLMNTTAHAKAHAIDKKTIKVKDKDKPRTTRRKVEPTTAPRHSPTPVGATGTSAVSTPGLSPHEQQVLDELTLERLQVLQDKRKAVVPTTSSNDAHTSSDVPTNNMEYDAPLGLSLRSIWSTSGITSAAHRGLHLDLMRHPTVVYVGALLYHANGRLVAIPGLQMTYPPNKNASVTSTQNVSSHTRPSQANHLTTNDSGGDRVVEQLCDTLPPLLSEEQEGSEASMQISAEKGDAPLSSSALSKPTTLPISSNVEHERSQLWVIDGQSYSFAYGYFPNASSTSTSTSTASSTFTNGRQLANSKQSTTDVTVCRGSFVGTLYHALLESTLAALRANHQSRSVVVFCPHQGFVDLMMRDWPERQAYLRRDCPTRFIPLAPLAPLLSQLQIESIGRQITFEYRAASIEPMTHLLNAVKKIGVVRVPKPRLPIGVPADVSTTSSNVAATRPLLLPILPHSSTMSSVWQNSIANNLQRGFTHSRISETPPRVCLDETRFMVPGEWWYEMRHSIAMPLLIISPRVNSVVRVRWLFDYKGKAEDIGASVLRGDVLDPEFVLMTREEKTRRLYLLHQPDDAHKTPRHLAQFEDDVWVPDHVRNSYSPYLWAIVRFLTTCPAFITNVRIHVESDKLESHIPVLVQSLQRTHLSKDDIKKHAFWLWFRMSALLHNRRAHFTYGSLAKTRNTRNISGVASVATATTTATVTTDTPTPTSLSPHVVAEQEALRVLACQQTRTSLGVLDPCSLDSSANMDE